jgi:TolB-like protein/class 3 adenylate cyclase
MATHSQSDLQFEIGHVLFIDIVGYSKLLIDQQRERIRELKEIVRGTEQFRMAEAEGKLLRLPTGDGGALVFRNTQEAPVLCALEISKALKKHPELRVRMGIHSGPVKEVADLNEQMNVAGAGINTARRVMDCGDTGHILLSKHVAEDLEAYEKWRPLLHDFGSCEVKHGARVAVVNLYGDQFGNAKLPRRFETLQKRRKRLLWVATVAALLALAVIVGGIAMFSRSRMRSTLAAPERSIAVLPFENRSRDLDNAYFADGIQDEILTRLSKIADLKVISGTSTQHYKSAPENLLEIARQLGVAHILEGSVQKSGDAVRVNVQLIKAANDSHLWADTFDRKLVDRAKSPKQSPTHCKRSLLAASNVPWRLSRQTIQRLTMRTSGAWLLKRARRPLQTIQRRPRVFTSEQCSSTPLLRWRGPDSLVRTLTCISVV